MSLTPEERQQIYEEEKARIEQEQATPSEVKRTPSEPLFAFDTEPGIAPVRKDSLGKQLVTVAVFFVALFFLVPYLSRPRDTSLDPTAPAAVPDTPPPATVEELAPIEKEKVVVLPDYRWDVNDDYDYVRGSVKNNSRLTTHYWKVSAQYLDKGGNVVDTEFTNSMDTLPPGAQKRFEIMHAVVPSAVRVKAFVEEVLFNTEVAPK